MAALTAWLLNTWLRTFPSKRHPRDTLPYDHLATLRFDVRQTVATSVELVAAPRQEVKIDPESVDYEFYDWLMVVYGWLAGLAEQATAGCSKEN